jgi:hypothetical protein
LEECIRKESERERIITDSRKKFTILVDRVNNKEQYEEVDRFSKQLWIDKLYSKTYKVRM